MNGELPRAVASGGGELAPSASDVLVPVEPRRVALVVGVLAAVYLAIAYCTLPVPTRVLGLFGIPGGELGRYGGLRMVWAPPPDLDPRALDRAEDGHGIHIERAADGYVVLVPHVAEDAVQSTAERIGGAGRLEFHQVLETSEMRDLAGVLGLAMRGKTAVDLDVDQWRADDGGRIHTDYYLHGPTREAIAAKLGEARQLGWHLPPGSHIAYERVERTRERSPFWRTYVLDDRAALDGGMISDAIGAYDPNTNRPVVNIEFDRDGAELFGDLTSRIAGGKLAIVLDGAVKSAPVINGAIRGGRAVITMGSGDPVQMEHDRDALVATLRAGALPSGGHVVSASYVAGAETATKRWAARLALAIAGGLGAALLAFLLVRVARPYRRRLRRLAGSASIKLPLAWTALAIVAYYAAASLPLPGVDGEDLQGMLESAKHVHWLGGVQLSIVALGVAPIISSSVLVEIVASIVPRWRKLRDGDAEARRRLGFVTAIVTVVLATVQAYFVVKYIRTLDRDGLLISHLDSMTRWAMVGSLAGGTLLIAWLASVITRKGLGNGYAVLIAASWLLRVVDPLDELDAAHVVLAVATIACVAVVVLGALRWRVRGLASATIPVPATGLLPLSSGGGIAALVALLASLGAIDLPYHAASWLDRLQLVTIGGAAVLVTCVAWSFAFARPGRRAGELARAGLRPTSREMWLRATALAAPVLVALFALAHVAAAELPALRILDVIDLAIAVVALADLWDEARDRRRGLVLAWQLHDPLLADVVRDRLDAAGIDHHLQASRLRTLLSPLASYIPIGVLVASDRVADAERELRGTLSPSSTTTVE